jgi:hypothetical protein
MGKLFDGLALLAVLRLPLLPLHQQESALPVWNNQWREGERRGESGEGDEKVRCNVVIVTMMMMGGGGEKCGRRQ